MSIESMKILLRSLYDAGVQSIKPGFLIRSALKIHENILEVNKNKYDLSGGKFYVLGFGKAVLPMAKEAEDILHPYISSGMILAPHTVTPCKCRFLEVYHGAKYNLPDADSLNATSKLIHLVKDLNKDDLVLCLVSGGGSALLTMPREGVSLEEKLFVTKLLSQAGANIIELNCVRKQLSAVKGGQLAKLIFPARTIALILSDVIGDPIDIISSGPTAESSVPLKAVDVISKYKLEDKIPNNVQNLLSNPIVISKDIFSSVDNFVIGNNYLALQLMSQKAEEEDFKSIIISNQVDKDVETISLLYWRLVKALCSAKDLNSVEELQNIISALRGKSSTAAEIFEAKSRKNVCLLAGGEPTILVKGKGKGGRSQELALRFSALAEKEALPQDVEIVFLAAGSDGMDGPTDAAGALAYPGQAKAAAAQGLNPNDFINNSDSYNFFKTFNQGHDHIITGHSGTNVMDFHMIAFKWR